MLSGNFFQITAFLSTGQFPEVIQIKASGKLNENHEIFKGHFPGNPVVPGVCQIQMIKELIEKALNGFFRLTESDNVKFLSMISPIKTPVVEFEIQIKWISPTVFSANATIIAGNLPMLKFKGKFESER